MSSNRCESGFPCSKYEVRKITSMDELWYYAKVFVNTAISQGLDPDIVVTMLIATLNELPLDSGIVCPNFNEYGKDSAQICDYIGSNTSVPNYTSCTALYHRIDNRTGACRICKLHPTLYRNKNEVIELSLVKYMLQSEENLSLVADYLTEDFFVSCMDVSLGIPVTKAYAIPMMRILVASLLKPNIRTFLFSDFTEGVSFNGSAFDTVWDDAYARFPRARKIPAVLTNNPVWKDVLKKHVKECIDTAPDLTRSGVIKIAEAYFKHKEIDSSKVIAKKKESDVPFVQMQVDDIVDVESTDVGNMPVGNVEAVVDSGSGFKSSDSNGMEAGVSENDSLQEDVSVSATAADEVNGNEGTDELESLAADSSSESDIDNGSEVDTADELQYVPDNESVATVNSKSVSYEVLSARNVILHLTIPNTCIHDKPLCLKENEHIPKEYDNSRVLYLSKDSSLPGAFYHGVLRDKQLPIEVVKKEDGTFLYLMFSRHVNHFFAVSPSEMPEVVKGLLSRNMVQKICHTPYLLYGVSKAYSLSVKNVFSIQTAHGRLVPGKELLPYKNLLNSYPLSRTYGEGVPESLVEGCMFLGGMPCYRSMCKVLTMMLDNSKYMADYLQDTLLDEALGCSYMYSTNFEDSGSLMILVENGKFLFKEEFNRSPKREGIYLSYLVRDMKRSYRLFYFILQRLAHKGIFRTCTIQVLGVHNGTMNLFVSLEEEEYIATVIDLLIFEYGRTYTKKGIDVECMRFK